MTTPTSRTALITGASRGLGLALARSLADRGWTVILDARDPERLAAARATLPPTASVAALAGDVNDPDHRAALVAAATAVGGLDVLINNASTLGLSPLPPLVHYPVDVLADVLRTNVLAPLALVQDLRGQFKPGVCVLNISSDAGVTAYPGWGGYGASKAALEQLSAVLAVEEPTWRVYWVDPGDMRTEMHQAAFPGEDISDRPPPEDRVPGLLTLLDSDLPSGRYTLSDQSQQVAP